MRGGTTSRRTSSGTISIRGRPGVTDRMSSYENQQNCRGDFDTVCGNGDRCHGYKNENQEKMYVHVLG